MNTMDLKHLSIHTSKISEVIPQQLATKTSTILRWTALGIAIRFLLMPLLAGPDYATTLWISFNLVKHNQLIFSNDPPVTFFLLGGFYKLMLPLFPSGFVDFITSRTAVTPPTFQVFALLQPGINTVLLLSKIPYLLFDIMSAYLVLHLFSNETKALTAFKIWLINPVVIVVSYVYGQFDIFLVFFIILALYFLKSKRYGWAMLTLGVGGIFKIVSLALLPFIAISYWKTIEEKTRKIKLFKTSRIFILGLLPLLSIPVTYFFVPQYYESLNFSLPVGTLFNGFFGTTFYTRGIVGQPLYSGLLTFLLDFSVSLRTQTLIPDLIYFIPFAYALLLLGAVYERKFRFEEVWKYFTVFLLAYYAFSLFHVQWFLWIQPFLIFLVVENRKIYGKLLALLITFYFVYTLQWDADLTSILIVPIIPQALAWSGPVAALMSVGFPALQTISIFRTFFSAICVFVIFHIVKTSFWATEQQKEELT